MSAHPYHMVRGDTLNFDLGGLRFTLHATRALTINAPWLADIARFLALGFLMADEHQVSLFLALVPCAVNEPTPWHVEEAIRVVTSERVHGRLSAEQYADAMHSLKGPSAYGVR